MKNPEANQNDDSKKLLCPKACILIHSSKEIPEIHGFALKLDDGPTALDDPS